MSTWPPTLTELKTDMKIKPGEGDSTNLDAQLEQTLDAAVAFVERVRPAFRYDQTDIAQFGLPDPTDDLRLGTLRLAGRWHIRRRSPDGMVAMGELGSARVASFDSDIERLLGIGRFAKPVIA